jgi:opacity protein-like surface antigen
MKRIVTALVIIILSTNIAIADYAGLGYLFGKGELTNWKYEHSLDYALKLSYGLKLIDHIYFEPSFIFIDYTPPTTIVDYAVWVPFFESGPEYLLNTAVNLRVIEGLYIFIGLQTGITTFTFKDQKPASKRGAFTIGYTFGTGYDFEILQRILIRLSLEYSKTNSHYRVNEDWDRWYENYYLIGGLSVFLKFNE